MPTQLFKKMENGTFVPLATNDIEAEERPISLEEPLANANEAMIDLLGSILIELKKANV